MRIRGLPSIVAPLFFVRAVRGRGVGLRPLNLVVSGGVSNANENAAYP